MLRYEKPVYYVINTNGRQWLTTSAEKMGEMACSPPKMSCEDRMMALKSIPALSYCRIFPKRQ